MSENAEFVEICQRCSIKFIGPDGDSIRLLGDKAIAKQTMKENCVPTIPGSDGEVATAEKEMCIRDSPHAADIAQVVLEEKVPVVTTGAGNPGKYIPD